MPPTEPLAVFHLAEEGAFSEGLVQAARVPDDGRGFIVVLDDDLRTRQMRGYQAYPPTNPQPEFVPVLQIGYGRRSSFIPECPEANRSRLAVMFHPILSRNRPY